MIDVSLSPKVFDVIREETEQFKALYLEASFDVLKDTQEKVSNIIMTIRDVTDVPTEELMKQDFLSLMSHKLRTPLTVITQSASILQKETVCGPLNDKQKEYIESGFKTVALTYKFDRWTIKVHGIEYDEARSTEGGDRAV